MASRPVAPAQAALAGAVAMLVLAACAPADDAVPGVAPSTGQDCARSSLETRTAGRLTIGTDQPAYEPWFVDDRPDSGEGFESAVAYAVAQRLGFAKDEVGWIRVRFNAAIAPGPKPYDFDINQFSITEERRQAVDFSSPYYLVRQTVVALKDSKIAQARSVAGLKNAKLGAQVGTTSYDAITRLIRPSAAPAVYNSNDDAKKALQNGQIDGLVVDLPTAFFITSAEIADSTIVGQLPQDGAAEQFGLVLDKGSPLTACVSRAVDQLRGDGTLARLEARWLAGATGAPELT